MACDNTTSEAAEGYVLQAGAVCVHDVNFGEV
jgi:hypothetical protein